MNEMKVAFLFFLFLAIPPIPHDPPKPPDRELVQALGCSCSGIRRNAIQCVELPAFADNEWTHGRATEFMTKAQNLAAQIEAMSQNLPGRYYFALQGSADRREIRHLRSWREASDKCRVGHDRISNLDLAFLRACELKHQFPKNLAHDVVILPSMDYTNPKARTDRTQTYSGDRYKAVTLFIIFQDRSICRDESQQRQQ